MMNPKNTKLGSRSASLASLGLRILFLHMGAQPPDDTAALIPFKRIRILLIKISILLISFFSISLHIFLFNLVFLYFFLFNLLFQFYFFLPPVRLHTLGYHVSKAPKNSTSHEVHHARPLPALFLIKVRKVE